MALVTICVLLCATALWVGGARAVLVAPAMIGDVDAPTSHQHTLIECRTSLEASILKRTDSTPTDARNAAALRCGVLVGQLALKDLGNADDI